MFRKEIVRSLSGLKIVWYPKEKVCMVLKEKSVRIYDSIPKKYKILFKDRSNK